MKGIIESVNDRLERRHDDPVVELIPVYTGKKWMLLDLLYATWPCSYKKYQQWFEIFFMVLIFYHFIAEQLKSAFSFYMDMQGTQNIG